MGMAPKGLCVLFIFHKKSRPENLSGIFLYALERETRFELATSTLARSHSTAELLPRGMQG